MNDNHKLTSCGYGTPQGNVHIHTGKIAVYKEPTICKYCKKESSGDHYDCYIMDLVEKRVEEILKEKGLI